MAYLKIVKKRK